MKVGVISVQGAFPEHISASERAMSSLGLEGEVFAVRKASELGGVDAIILPGGESTTISRLLVRFHIHDRIVELARNGTPMMGTCAGLVLMAKEGDDEVERTGTKLLGLMDMSVDRNAFGRQRESFEAPLDLKGLDAPFPGVFIRAPIIRKVWNGCEEIARHGNDIVMARQGNLLALSFHPELSGDLRVHEMLLKLV
ncbi:MAG: pyridoxal 5'-phosphate synthase glutaminase subunit PdxT [Methanomassiliicoccales archaeon]|nr:pyridoxal 5'-phosphate synthase glutaminase subunit PdxT [Methanomassiliicoccales archaeon]